MQEPLQGLASRHESANYPDLSLTEEVLKDLQENCFDFNLTGRLLCGVDATETDEFLLE